MDLPQKRLVVCLQGVCFIDLNSLFFFVLTQKRKKKGQARPNAPQAGPPTRTNDCSPHLNEEHHPRPKRNS